MFTTTKITVLLCGVFVTGLPALASNNARKVVPPKAPAQEPAQPVAIPEPPPTPEHSPASPPQVTMNGGQLSIVAENSTLGDVLSAVRKLTGAGVEVPSAANNERVAVQLGPGNPSQVLQELFAGSKFNYIILGSPDSTTAIQKIILTARTAGGASAPGPVNNADNSNYNPYNRVHSQPPPPPPDYQADSGVDDEITQPEAPTAEEVTPPADNQQGQMPYAGPSGQAQQQQQEPQVIPLEQIGPKTPEQLLQELQRMQQQQQQNQNDQSRPPRSSVQQ
jgi:type II secretory pathway component GspD/PulD (secretin)